MILILRALACLNGIMARIVRSGRDFIDRKTPCDSAQHGVISKAWAEVIPPEEEHSHHLQLRTSQLQKLQLLQRLPRPSLPAPWLGAGSVDRFVRDVKTIADDGRKGVLGYDVSHDRSQTQAFVVNIGCEMLAQTLGSSALKGANTKWQILFRWIVSTGG
jgi:hypothetical protein